MPKCPLCDSEGIPVDPRYLDCTVCRGRFLDPVFLPGPEEEMAEYLKHKNDVLDPRYQAFVKPLTDSVLEHHAPTDDGLDVGSGPDSVIAHVLQGHGFRMHAYDPFFRPDAALLERRYRFVTCSETVEHFHHPRMEFERLNRILEPGGTLHILTLLYDDSIPFANWHYRRDPTHVFLYRAETFSWIRENLQFSELHITNRLIRLTKC